MSLALGNLVADQVKGSLYKDYSPPIQKGILLHRKIDNYADNHPIVKDASNLLFAKYRHFSKVIIDMYFDHFLARHWSDFHPKPLVEFTTTFYRFVLKEKHMFSNNIQIFLQKLINLDWLMKYAEFDDLKSILWMMEQKIPHHSKLSESVDDLKANYNYFQTLFFNFMINIKQEVKYSNLSL